MFTYCIQKDTIRIEPCDFGKDPAVALKEEINRRYANKVIYGAGLCISLLDILDASEGAVLYGDGCFYHHTEFRLIMFRPFIGEAIVGRVQSQTEQGITINLNFFEDITIPAPFLPEYSVFDRERQCFFWVVPPDNLPKTRPRDEVLMDTPSDQRLYIEKKDWVRVRVEEEYWDDTSPGSGRLEGNMAPVPVNGAAIVGAIIGGKISEDSTTNKTRVPYRLVCSMSEPGTGVLEWWDDDSEEMVGEDD